MAWCSGLASGLLSPASCPGVPLPVQQLDFPSLAHTCQSRSNQIRQRTLSTRWYRNHITCPKYICQIETSSFLSLSSAWLSDLKKSLLLHWPKTYFPFSSLPPHQPCQPCQPCQIITRSPSWPTLLGRAVWPSNGKKWKLWKKIGICISLAFWTSSFQMDTLSLFPCKPFSPLLSLWVILSTNHGGCHLVDQTALSIFLIARLWISQPSWLEYW